MGGAAWEIPGFSFSLPANADYSSEAAFMFTPVRAIAASGTGINTPVAAAPVAASGDPIIGVMQNNPQLAEAATIVNNGVTKALCKGVIAIGAKMAATPSGGFMTGVTGNYGVGIALDVGAANQYIPMLLVNLGILP